ncbi:MAG TPA: hypothetical protein VIQ11_03080 [Mycobacterium sp.]
MNLDDLIDNQSISPDGADILRAIAETRQSFLVHALPQNAGKSTVAQAILAEVAPGVPRNEFYGTEQEVASLSAASTRGYLVVAEIGHHGRPGYLAGQEVPRIFDLLAGGYSLASSLHADTVDQVFEVLAANGVPTTVAASVPYLIKVRMLSNESGTHVRRVVDEIHEVSANGSAVPTSTQLYHWDGRIAGTPASWLEAPQHRPRGPRQR